MFSKKKIVLDLDNTHFDVYCSSSSDSEGNALKTFHLYIFNDYKNLVGIDLNKSDIRQRPAKFYYKFFDINNPKDDSLDLKNELNQFLRGSSDFENPFHCDLRKYIKAYIPTSGRYVKLNDNFFIYYFKDPLGCSCIRIVMIIISIIVNFFLLVKCYH